MPELVQLYRKYADKGFSVIGINFDHQEQVAIKATKEHALPWPQVHANKAAKGRDDFWDRVTGISGLPRLFLIDRDGVLRDDFYPHDLEKKIVELLDED